MKTLTIAALLLAAMEVGCTSATTPPGAPTAPTTTLSAPQPTAPIPRFSVSGVVHETAPTQAVPIAGARVTIRSGPYDGETTTTDSVGRFTFDGIDAPGFSIVMSKPDYDLTTYDITSLTQDRQLDLGMAPSLSAKTYHFQGGESCVLQSIGLTNGPTGRIVGEISVHHDGLSSFDSLWSCPCFFDGNGVQILGRSENDQLFSVAITRTGGPSSGTASLKAGYRYVLVRSGEGDHCSGGYSGDRFDWSWVAPN